MSPYARGTAVPVMKSRMEVEQMLQRHNADRIGVAYDRARGVAIVGFVLEGRAIRFRMSLPPDDPTVRKAQRDRWEAVCRQRWRALVLALKSKFVSIEEGIETTEQAFLAHVVDPESKRTVYEMLGARLAEGYRKSGLPELPAGEVSP